MITDSYLIVIAIAVNLCIFTIKLLFKYGKTINIKTGFPHFFTGEIQGYFQVFKGHFFRFQGPFFHFQGRESRSKLQLQFLPCQIEHPPAQLRRCADFTAAREDWCGCHSETCGRGRICKRLFEPDLTVHIIYN